MLNERKIMLGCSYRGKDGETQKVVDIKNGEWLSHHGYMVPASSLYCLLERADGRRHWYRLRDFQREVNSNAR